MLNPTKTKPATQLKPFRPAAWAKGGDLQTLLGYLLPGPNELPHTLLHHMLLPDSDTLVICENRPAQTPVGVVLLMHGLGGHADSAYMLRVAAKFLSRGWIVFRMNHRGAGQGRGLARRLYHSGKSEDLPPVLDTLRQLFPGLPLVVIGFSLSGNVLLKYLGETGADNPFDIARAIAVCPPIDLQRCADALSRRRNWLYDLRFSRLLRSMVREMQAHFPDFPRISLPFHLTVYEFDQRVTAPLNGFASAEDYYRRCSAAPLLANIRIPVDILASDDDPFVPAAMFRSVPNDNGAIELHLTRSGGHMGFLSAFETSFGDRRWMDEALLHFATRAL